MLKTNFITTQTELVRDKQVKLWREARAMLSNLVSIDIQVMFAKWAFQGLILMG